MILNVDNIKPLLDLLEKVNPCNCEYETKDGTIIVSYSIKLNIFNFTKWFPVYIKTRIIGLPISLSEKGYWGDINIVKQLIHRKKGLKIVLNAENDLGTSGQTLSTFVFYNKFKSFDDYTGSLRCSYRRRIKKALNHKSRLIIREMDKKDFADEHYKLYLSIMERTENPLEILSKEFFIEFESELYEFLDVNSKAIVGFIQLKQIEDCLYFFFGGFHREDNEKYDLYYNMLIKIIELGIGRGVKTINFGQTAEESKLKIGCVEVKKYLYIHHSNMLINKALQLLAPLFTYKGYNTVHNVFKLNSKETVL
ncbi:MAG: hypothetical protein GX787_02600 [Tissierellia bacterium]|nr:hypothetical protein [Tissierellia bacterium]